MLRSMTYEQSAPPMLYGHVQLQIPLPKFTKSPYTHGILQATFYLKRIS